MEAPSSAQSHAHANPNDAMLAITLSVSRGGHSQPQHTTRRLVFTPEKPIVSVGRASKVTSKGFVALESNACFDSPVMSRHHAEFVANFDDMSVSIRDCGSLHGTFYTSIDTSMETQLVRGQTQRLTHQDVLRFGIDIFRSDITHPPTIVSIEISEDQRRGTSRRLTPTYKFSVPDDIDSEDAMEEDNEDAEDAPSIYGGQSLSHAVDLTDDKSELIDLTSEPDQTLHVHEVSASTQVEEELPTEAVPFEDSPTYGWDSFYQSSVRSDESDDEDGDDMHEGSEVDDDCDHDCDDDGELREDEESSLCSEIDDGMDVMDESEEEDNFSLATNASEEGLSTNLPNANSLAVEAQSDIRSKSPSDFIFQTSSDACAHATFTWSKDVHLSQTHAEPKTDVSLEPAAAQAASVWEDSAVNFINDPEAIPLFSCSGAPGDDKHYLDETSAFAYEQSKAGTVKRLLISDLLASEPHSAVVSNLGESFATTSTKRTFETAFPAEEIEPVVEIVTNDQEPAVDAVAIVRRIIKPRSHSPKRRRVAELAACLALGGAGVLSALIYTAPSFA